MDENIILIVALIFSVILHEMAHGYAANWLGDPTARLQGRLTANPLVHIDPLMSVIIPALLIVTGSPIVFGAAKPVPYNPYNLKDQRWGEAIVAAAGPFTNILIAVVFALLMRNSEILGLNASFLSISLSVVFLNIFLAIFNLIPIPPLDGSKILARVLPTSLADKYREFCFVFERNIFLGMFLVIFVFFFLLEESVIDFVSWISYLLIGG